MNDPVRFVVKSRAQENSWLPVPGFSFYWNLGAVQSSCNGRSSLAGSSLRRSGLRRSGLAGSSLRRRTVLLCNSGRSALLGLSSNRSAGRSSLGRGCSSGGSRTAASGHANSQSQSNNSNTNILEFHIKNLLAFEKSFAEGCTGEAFPQEDILVRFRKKSSPFLTKILFSEEILHFCYNLSPKVKDF